MSETATSTQPAGKTKAGKLYKKESRGTLHAVSAEQTAPFFKPILSKKDHTALTPQAVITPFFIPGIHLMAEEDPLQRCTTCEPEPPVHVQAKCAACEAEEGLQGAQDTTVREKEPETAVDTVMKAEPAIDRCAQCDAEPLPVQPALKVSKPGDPLEVEADRSAEQVMKMSRLDFAGGGGVRPGNNGGAINRSEDDGEGADLMAKPLPSLQRSPDGSLGATAGFAGRLSASGSGTSMPAPVQQGMETAFQADFSAIRIHTGTEAAALSNDIGAQAFAYKNHIYFNENKFEPGSQDGQFLLAHELTHTLQQGAAKTVQRDTEDPPPAKEESWLDKLKSGAESVLKTVVPASVYDIYIKIKNGGLINYIKEMLFGLFRSLFNKIGFSDTEILVIIQIFVTLKNKLPLIIDGLNKGDCKPLFEAMNMLSFVLGEIAGRVWDRLMEAIEPARLWLLDIWNTYISPAIDKITAFFGEEWEKLKRFGKWLWNLFYQYIVQPYVDAWEWVSEKLGIGQSDEPGLLGWVSDKMSAAWEEIKKDLKPVIDPIQDVISGIKSLVNMEAVRKLQEDAKQWLDEVVKTATEMGSDDDAVANKQVTFRDVLLPALNKAIDKVKVALHAAGDWLVGQVNNVADNINGFVTGIKQNSYLSPIASVVSWIPKTVDKIRDWASDKVNGLFNFLADGAEKLRKFIQPVLAMLEKIIGVVGNLLGKLPDFILGFPFMILPKCIKDPILKWITEVILKKIPIIAEFIELAEKWEEIKAAAILVLKQVFIDGQLGKGLWTFFKTLLGLLGIDPGLVTKVVAKAAQNFSDIISKPGAFFKNIWLVVKGGFKRFFDNILIHLPKGALDWLFGEVKGAVEVAPPKDFTLGSILGYTMDLFGINKENVYKRMELNPRIGPKKVAKIRKMEAILTGALEWITVWVKEGPAGLLRKAKEKLDSLRDMVINGIVSWVTAKIGAEIMKRLATSSDPLGIGATINTIILIYDTIKTAVAYINRMLNIANQAMDDLAAIIAGNIEKAEKGFEEILAKAVPLVIGFAVEVIIGPVGGKIKEIITDARKAIDDAIDALINMALDAIDSIINTAKDIAGAVLGWLGLTKSFTADNGETHTLSFSGTEKSAEIMVASAPKPFKVWIASVTIANPGTKEGKDLQSKKDKAIAKHDTIKATETKKETEKYTADDKEKELKKLLDELSELLAPLFGKALEDCASEPNGRLQFGSKYKGYYGGSMLAKGLTKIKMPAGSEPNVDTPDTYRVINQRRSGVGSGSYYVLGHLLNHNLGGTGLDMKNLTPLTRSANGTHHSLVESNIKTSVSEGNSVEYKVVPAYGRSAPQSKLDAVDNARVEGKEDIKNIIRAEVNVPKALECDAFLINPQNDEKTTLFKKTISNDIDQAPTSYELTGMKRGDVRLTGSLADISKVEKPMTDELARKIVKSVKVKFAETDTRFSSFESLKSYQIGDKDVFSKSEKNDLDTISTLPYVKLY